MMVVDVDEWSEEWSGNNQKKYEMMANRKNKNRAIFG